MDSTMRQIYLQRCLGVPTPEYLHVPVVTNDQGEKLSKQNGATALDPERPLETLGAAAKHLGLELGGATPKSLENFHAAATAAWAKRMSREEMR
jgi:glutamyl-Q tRNA(Asp) synthetase